MADAAQVYRARPTEAEIADVLSQPVVATVGTLNQDGTIHLAYVLFQHHVGRMYFETSSLTRKARNAERAGQASMVVQGRAATGHSLMVSQEGTARVIRGAEAHDINHRLRAKYIRAEVLADVARVWAELDDVAVEITPRRQRSWTSVALHKRTEDALGLPFGHIWLPED
jgi:hypothetical protein